MLFSIFGNLAIEKDKDTFEKLIEDLFLCGGFIGLHSSRYSILTLI